MKSTNRRTTLLFAVAALAIVTSQPAVSAGLFGSSPEPLVLKATSPAGETFQQMIDDGNPLRHVSKVYSGPSRTAAIGMVRINFVTDASDSARTKEFMGKATATASSNMKLVGVTPEIMQSITENFHAALRRSLTAQGYEVVAQDKLLENTDYKEAVAASKSPDVSIMGSVTSVYATGTGNIETFGMRNFAFNQKMPVVIADLTLNFAAFEKNTDRWSQGGYSISAGIESRVASTLGGRMRIMTEDGGGQTFDIVRPLVLPGKIDSRVEQISASGAEKAGAIALGVVAALMGSKDASSTVNYNVFAANNYRETVSTDLERVAEVVASVLQKRN